jgi:uncharacterized protein (DUF433 family)
MASSGVGGVGLACVKLSPPIYHTAVGVPAEKLTNVILWLEARGLIGVVALSVGARAVVGKPVVKGTRIPVSLILNLLEHGYDFARIREDYPILTDDDIKAAIAYAQARLNREDIRPLHL